MSHTTVLVVLRGARSDYVRPETMPFLAGLARTSLTARFEAPPGFAQRTILFSGRSPSAGADLGAYTFDPERSPFRWVRALGPLRGLVRPRKVAWIGRRILARVTRWLTGVRESDPAWIPPHCLPYFRPSDDRKAVHEPRALGAPSLFDLMRERGQTFRYLAPPVADDDTWVYNTLVKELRERRPYHLYVAQFSELDELGGAKGPFSDDMDRPLRLLDERLASIHAALATSYDTWDLLVCGDHGMAPVTRRIDLLAQLKTLDAKPGRDYVVFVHSTMAIFWYFTDKGRQAIETLLPRVPSCRVLDDAQRARAQLPMGREFGDRILAADPGVLFWPDYFHVRDSQVLGMHGYLDRTLEGHPLGLLATSEDETGRRLAAPRPLADVFATLCALLGLQPPPEAQGERLLDERLVRARPGPAPAPQVVANA